MTKYNCKTAPNGSFEKFKTEEIDLYERCVARFDHLTGDRARINQRRLVERCKSSDEIRALMVYLVEKCKIQVAFVIREIKRHDLPLAFDLARGLAA